MRQTCCKLALSVKALGGLLAVLLTVGLTPNPADAQVLYGSLVGNVTDQNGAVVSGATVTITNKGTGQTRETATSESGEYSITNILPGDYDVKVTKQGFSTFTQTDLKITTNNVTRVEVQIKVGNVSDVVSVTADQTLLQSDTAEVKSQLTTKEITDLPTNQYRNYQALINLVPGATPAAFQNAITDTPARSLRTFVNGTNPNNNTTRLDGAINVFIWLPHHNVYVAPVETVQEVSITTDSFDAEQGLAGGAAISVQTKSGGNRFHGSAFAFHNNQHFNAKNFFFPANTKLNKSITNINGGTFSGPIKRDKLFFFGSWEGTRERVGRFSIESVPTAEMRAGNFAGLGVTIYDPISSTTPAQRTAFANAQIPTARISPIAKKVLDFIPLPNLPGDSPGRRNYFASGSEAMNRDNFDAKINWNRTPAHQIWGKFSAMDAQVNALPSLGEAVGPPLGGLAGTGNTKVYLATVGQTWTIKNFVVDGNFGLTRMDQSAQGVDFGKNIGSEVLGVPGTNGSDERQSGFPVFSFGFSNVGQQAGWSPVTRNDRSYTGTVNVGHVSGPHDMRFGFDMVHHQLNHWQPEILNGPRGALFFNGQSVLPGAGSPNLYHSLAQFLLGYTSAVNNTIQHELMTGREWQFGWYFRDRWQVTRNLTATLGLRYEYYPLMTRANRGIERLDVNTFDVLLGGVGGNPTNLDMTVSKKLFAPRLGLAYRLGDNMVIRSGYGITYDPLPFSRPLRGFYPLTIAQQFDAPGSYQYYGTIQQGIPLITGPDLSSGRVHMPTNVDERTPPGGLIHRGYIQSWNLMVERKILADLTVSAGYVGTQTTHQLANLNINAADVGRGNAGRPFASRGYVRNINLFDGRASSNYHALQTTINRRFTRGLYIKSAYTWSRAINLADEDGGVALPWNSQSQFYRNRAPAGYDRTHMFTFGYAYELPFGKGKSWVSKDGVASALLGGWQINGVYSAYTGTPFTVTASDVSCNCPGNQQTADVISPDIKITGNYGSGTPYFDVLAFRDPARSLQSGQFRYGTTGRNAYRGPGYWNLDFSLFRRFSLSERFRMDFRTEAYNVFNHPQFGNPGSNVSSLQFNPDGSLRAFNGFGEITGTVNSERRIRFAIRLEF